MPGFNLYLSNHSEVLVDQLAHVVGEPPLPPFEAEVIVVQSQGMERWLTQQLSEKLGIWANGRFPFPNLMVQQIFQAVLKEDIPDPSTSSELMAWRLQRVLPACVDRPEFENLKNYLGTEKRDLKSAQLCQQIADTFDQYTLYRPEMILRWEEGQETHWQAQLWRRIVAEGQTAHRADIRRRFFQALQQRKLDLSELPRRISIFGIPALPRFHLDVFVVVSHFVDVHLFLMNPSQEFWADIVSERELARRRERQRRQYALPFPEDHHFEVGNPLLASLGKVGKEFFGMLLDQNNYVEWSRYADAGEDSVLACLQSDILKLHHRGEGGLRKVLSSGDDSLQIHSCHSPMREMEVLRDRLLALFDEHPDLRPEHVLVMTPDIQAYAPYITAVFSGDREAEQRIPFSISDRNAKSESPLAQGFLKILDLSGSRLAVSAVMDLLDMSIVLRRFGIQVEDHEQILEWVKETRICWGIDGEDRQRQGIPAFDENSWRAGLDRLLLGYALPSLGAQTFAGILPFDGVEGSGSQALGRLVEFLERLFTTVRDLERPRPLSGWSESLSALLSQFFAEEEESEREFQMVRRHVRRLAEIQKETGYEQAVPLEVIRYTLERRLQVSELNRWFLTGGVTFCAMLPMRSIPFRVIALVGMNNDAFPRAHQPLSFDLVASHPLPGDRSLREEDRYLFLEALLSAREHFHISYVGQSTRDNSEIPPSVLVSELMDVVEQGFVFAGAEPISQRLSIRHRLQAFSPFYFSGMSQLFSFSQENLMALKAQRSSDWRPRPFIPASIGEPPTELRRIDVRELKRFYRNPTKFLLRRRLGIVLDEAHSLLEDSEPFVLKELDAYGLKQELAARHLAGAEISTSYASMRGQGILPAGKAGEILFREVVSNVEAFTASLRPLLSGEVLPALELDLELAGFHVMGRIDDVWTDHVLRYRCAEAKAKDHVNLWIDHLLLHCAGPTGYPRTSILVTQDGVWSLPPVRDCRLILERLCRLYWQGLSKPLQFFPQTSYQYVHSRRNGASQEEAMSDAGRIWNGSRHKRGEREDAYYELAFRQVKPLDEVFVSVALDVLVPVLEHERLRSE
jgi:exodeoxyribonuclease V gamma subunit